MDGGAGMIHAECFDLHDKPIDFYTQWDVDQTIKIILKGVEGEEFLKYPPNVHFANARSTEALVVRSTVEGNDTIIVDIPNLILQEGYPLLIYVYLQDSRYVNSQKTILKIEIPVRKRVRPSNYNYVENIDRVTAEQIKEEIKNEIADDIWNSILSIKGITFTDVVTGILHKLYISDGKMILENLGTTVAGEKDSRIDSLIDALKYSEMIKMKGE